MFSKATLPVREYPLASALQAAPPKFSVDPSVDLLLPVFTPEYSPRFCPRFRGFFFL